MINIYNILVDYKITPNALYVLESLNDNSILHNHLVNFKIEMLFLERSGLMQKGEITQEGFQLLQKIHKKPKKLIYEAIKDKLETYNNFFPKIRKDGKFSVRSNPKELVDKFDWFFNTYPEYDWEKVLEATKIYVDGFEGDYTYIQLSKYFVKKEDKNRNVSSTLASICYDIDTGVSSETGYHYFGI
jgi:hypothetical protein